MSKKKDINYNNAREYLFNKDLAINTFFKNSFNKTIGMFKYENLPDTIPSNELEKLLQYNGHCIIAKEGENLYAFNGGFSGETDVYGNPTQYTVANVALNLTKVYNIGIDCVLIPNDFELQGLIPLFSKYGTEIVDTEISLDLATVLMRIVMLISAPDDRTKESAELFIKKIFDGDFAVIGDTPFFDGVKMQNATNQNSRYLTQFIELMQYYKASFYNEIGLNANYNMKRERLSENEIGLNVDAILPLIDEMYSERVKAIEEVNNMFGTEIVVDYNSVWKTTHEEEEKETVNSETDIEDNVKENAENFSDESIAEINEEAEEAEEVEEDEKIEEVVEEIVEEVVEELDDKEGEKENEEN